MIAVLFVVPAAVMGAPTAAGALGPNAIRAGFTGTAFPGNDDESVTVTLPFSVNFFGTTYSQLFLNNNGNVTFDAPLSEFTPFDLFNAGVRIIAPFFADVDTRAGNTAAYGTTTVNGHNAWGATWPGVGCFSVNTSVLNYFQMVLIDRSDVATGAFDIEFNYDQVQWDSGQASGGDASCLNGGSAHAGYSNGSAASSFEIPGSGINNAFLDSNAATGLVNHSLGTTQLGRYIFSVRNGQPTTPTTLTTSLSAGEQSGASVTVPSNTQVTDSATLSGANAATATGSVTYTVFSDPSCETSVASGGTKAVTAGSVPNSNPVSLAFPGTYYWQAVYSGDGLNNGSNNTCGDETETVTSNGDSAAGFVPAGGSLTTGGNNPSTLSLPTPPGAFVTLNHVFGATFCSGTCTGPATFVNNFPGYTDRHHPIDLKLTVSFANRGLAVKDFVSGRGFKLIDDPSSPAFGSVIPIPDCKDNPSWTRAQKQAAALRRALRLGTHSGIADPSPCIDSRLVRQRADGVWQTTYEILYLSNDGGFGRR
jgi:hypothetical protein